MERSILSFPSVFLQLQQPVRYLLHGNILRHLLSLKYFNAPPYQVPRHEQLTLGISVLFISLLPPSHPPTHPPPFLPSFLPSFQLTSIILPHHVQNMGNCPYQESGIELMQSKIISASKTPPFHVSALLPHMGIAQAQHGIVHCHKWHCSVQRARLRSSLMSCLWIKHCCVLCTAPSWIGLWLTVLYYIIKIYSL